MIHKGKISLYSSRNYIQLQSVVSLITSWKHTIQAALKKKGGGPLERKRKGKRDGKRRRKGKRWERGEEEKRDGKSLCVRKGKRENEMWKKRRKGGRENEREGEGEEKERKRKKNRKQRKWHKKCAALST